MLRDDHSKEKEKNTTTTTTTTIIIIIIIMKALCFTLGLLLLTACCCNAMPKAVQFSTEPVSCCLKFFPRSLPVKFVADIIKTHSSCRQQGFVVQTIRGREICFAQTFPWAQDVYNRFRNTEGSGL